MTRTSLLLDLAGVLFLGAAFALDHWAAGQVPDIVRGLLYGIGAGALIASLLHLRFSRGSDMSTPAQRRRYLREMIPLAIGYAVAVLASVTLLKHVDGTALRAMIALLPVPFVALMLRAMIRHIREADEMQRRIEVEAVSISAALVSLAYLAGGLLQFAKVIALPAGAAMLWVFPMLCLVYGVAKIVVSRRYG